MKTFRIEIPIFLSVITISCGKSKFHLFFSQNAISDAFNSRVKRHDSVTFRSSSRPSILQFDFLGEYSIFLATATERMICRSRVCDRSGAEPCRIPPRFQCLYNGRTASDPQRRIYRNGERCVGLTLISKVAWGEMTGNAQDPVLQSRSREKVSWPNSKTTFTSASCISTTTRFTWNHHILTDSTTTWEWSSDTMDRM